MSGKTLALGALLWMMLTPHRQERLSLPITHATVSQAQPVTVSQAQPVTVSQPQPVTVSQPEPVTVSQPEPINTIAAAPDPVSLEPGTSCYKFILLRPKDQRATAVQVRLKQADAMVAALERTIKVDLVGDHVNILSLQFPMRWPAPPSVADHVSTIVENYFSSPDVEDDLCNSGFAEVRLSARGLNDGRIHPIWTARVTSEGLLKVGPDGEQLATFTPAF
jgi:hypothetical protein